jgi:hypothetical protein
VVSPLRGRPETPVFTFSQWSLSCYRAIKTNMLVETIAISSCRTILELQSELDAILLDCFDLTPWREDIGDPSRLRSLSTDHRTGCSAFPV